MDQKAASGGMGLASVLFVVFLILKLTKLISWSWWWVFSPLLIEAGLILIIFIVCFILAIIKEKQ